jgi:predicted N-acetyltransferase YhbS
MLTYREEMPADAPAIEALLDRAFGPGRQGKASYAFRRGVAPIEALSRVALDAEGRLLGTIRYWPIEVGGTPALLLGPVGVEPERQGSGIGRTLIHETLAKANALGATAVFLVGDPAYYGPLGFQPAGRFATMPHEDPNRVQARPLGAARCLPTGEIRRAVPVLQAVG